MKNSPVTEDLKMSAAFSRVHCSDGTTHIRFEVRDLTSSIRFLDLKISLEDFAKMVTGQAADCTGTVRGADNVGKRQEHEVHEFSLAGIPDGILRYSTEYKQAIIEEGLKSTPEGWVMDQYFSSRGSTFTKDGEPFAQTIIRRWV